MAIVKWTPEAFAQAANLPKSMKQRVTTMVKRLEKWPTVSGVKQLSGNLSGLYRARVGDYRILFRIEIEKNKNEEEKQPIVLVEKIAHRKDVYED